ncbi:hypothetical protein MNAN1_000929 [Malassezia nana]|uniref:Uncharacterized protein n=1 Tax=Malassezia nana TaxID=180528 RepID=A0AAF0J1E0_9BASI|nr:hypothetical protein MNAN1_000929 [Malassezia nana]
MLSPVLAFHEAREVCMDLAALYAASEFTIALPESAKVGDQTRIHYDEWVRLHLRLRLPSVPTRLPPPRDDAGVFVTALDKKSIQQLPPRLAALATALQLRVRTALQPASPLSVYEWQGLGATTDFCVRQPEPLREAPRASPLCDDTGRSGIVYDTTTKAWYIHWHCDMAISYMDARGSDAALRITADLGLRLDLGTLTAHAHVPRPQAPFHYTSHAVHPCMLSDDPYLIEADLLSELSSTVKVPDETPEQRHAHLASQLTLLPASMLAPGVVGSETVAPWSEALQLAQRLHRAQELEAAALASDADIALSSWTSATPPKPTHPTLQRTASEPAAVPPAPPAMDVPTLALSGLVVLRRTAQADAQVRSLITVRMRTLPHLYPAPSTAMLVCVELESTSHDLPFEVHAISMDLDATTRGVSEPDTGVQLEVAPLGAPDEFPLRLGPHSQHNLLYTVRVQCAYMDTASTLHALAAWSPCRRMRIVLHGTPIRTDGPTSVTCVSEWNGTIDLTLAQLDLQRTCTADQAVAQAVGASVALPAPELKSLPDAPPQPPPKPWRASLSANECASMVRRALPWRQMDTHTLGWDTAVGTFLAKVEVAQHSSTLGLARLDVQVSLLHLGTSNVDLELRWLAEADSAPALLPECPRISLGRVAPGGGRAGTLVVHSLEAGYHVLGPIGVLDRVTGVLCVLPHVGAAYVATANDSATT